MRFKPGQVIRFTYTHQAVDAHTGDKYKEVLVLHPNWQNKVHGIDLRRLSPAERKVLEIILDPEQKNVPSRIPLINKIRQRMDPIQEIQNPMTFYTKFVRPFLNGKDAYRTYIPHNMVNTVVVRDASIATGKKPVENPLFGKKPEQTPQQVQAQAQKPLTPIDAMKAAQDARAVPPATPFGKKPGKK